MSQPKIIVGVDSSAGSRQAVDFAAEEALRTGRELVVINAYDWHVAGARFQVAGGYAEDLRQVAEGIVQSAVTDAAADAPGVNVRGEVAVGPAGRILADASSPDTLVVVGHRGRGGFASLLLGSVGHYVATHARGPVVVVRGRRDIDSGPVVVGVDTAGSDAALRLAFEEASSRGTGLVAVHAYTPLTAVVAYGVMPSIEDDKERHANELAALKDTLSMWMEKYPDVKVEVSAVTGHPTEVLVGLSRTARLVVIGHRGGGLGNVQLGSVASQLLYHAECSVLIARTGDTTI